MNIAIPLVEGKLSMHFGHCDRFALISVDPEEGVILQRSEIDAPPHQPGLLPAWLAERGANMIIAGGMGQRAKDLFSQSGIEVLVGAPVRDPETLVTQYMEGSLETGSNTCDH